MRRFFDAHPIAVGLSLLFVIMVVLDAVVTCAIVNFFFHTAIGRVALCYAPG